MYSLPVASMLYFRYRFIWRQLHEASTIVWRSVTFYLCHAMVMTSLLLITVNATSLRIMRLLAVGKNSALV